MSIDYYKKNGKGASLIPGRHNIDKYLKDMDKRNKEIFERRKRKISTDGQAGLAEDFNRIVGISIVGYSKKYAENWEVIYGTKK